MRGVLVRLAVVASVVTAAGCGGGGAGSEIRCTTSRDCPGGRICRDGVCALFCDTDDDCPGGVCDTGRDICVDCFTREHCIGLTAPDGPVECDERSNSCFFYCTKDNQCPADRFCAAGACQLRQCEVNADCAGGQKCRRYQCIPIDRTEPPFPAVCEEPETICTDSRHLSRCVAGGFRYWHACGEREACGGGECRTVTVDGDGSDGDVTEGDNGEAEPDGPDGEPCEPGARRCSRETVVERCLTDGSWEYFTRCFDEERCVDGYCVKG